MVPLMLPLLVSCAPAAIIAVAMKTEQRAVLIQRVRCVISIASKELLNCQFFYGWRLGIVRASGSRATCQRCLMLKNGKGTSAEELQGNQAKPVEGPTCGTDKDSW
jgi:hypothetical protein